MSLGTRAERARRIVASRVHRRAHPGRPSAGAPRRLRRAIAAILTALTLLAPWRGGAHAEPAPISAADRKAAAELKKQGDDAMIFLRYGDALDAYTRAYQLTGEPALLYNRGRAFQALGKFPQALEQIEAFDAQAPVQLKARVPALDALLAELREKVAAITLSSNVDGARILVEKQVVGATPLKGALKLNAGSVLIEVEAEGYEPFRQRIELRAGPTSNIVANLSPKNKIGVLSVVSSTSGARVLVDDKPAGSVPVELSVKAGLHAIRVEREGYEPVSTSVMIVAGARKQVTVPLAPTPLTHRWWFWTSIGGGVTAAVIIAAQFIPRPLHPGSLPPYFISWPPPAKGGAATP